MLFLLNVMLNVIGINYKRARKELGNANDCSSGSRCGNIYVWLTTMLTLQPIVL